MLKIDTEKRYRVMIPDFNMLQIVVVGIGGTGSAVAIDLARLAYHCEQNGLPVMMQLIDGDKVEPKNVGRQQFSEFEVGENKATSMARRLNLWLGLDVMGTPKMLTKKTSLIFNDGDLKPLRIIVGAVDNHQARQAIAGFLQGTGAWWVDTGNGEFKGQVLVGNHLRWGTVEVTEELGLVNGLPSPAQQMPELLEAEVAPVLQFEDCALRILRDEQSININRLMATYAAQVVYDLVIRRELDYMAIHASFRPPSAMAVPVTRRTLERYVTVQELWDTALPDPTEMEFDDEEDFEQWMLDMEMEGEELP